MIIQAQCHCGNIAIRFSTERKPDHLNPRTCPCSFCTMHGARYISDAQGSATITIGDHENIIRYRFAEDSADFLVCNRCGIYVAAVIEEQEQCWSALNLNLTDYRNLDAPPVSKWKDQSRQTRIDFRKRIWTPTTLA